MSMRTRWRSLLSGIALLATTLSLSGCGKPEIIPYAVKLDVWGVFDDSDALQSIFTEYKKLNPYVKTIEYRKMAPESYREDLLNALAAGTGPDIFMVQNTWRDDFSDKVVPAPATFANEKKFRETFVDVVASDFLGSGGDIFAAPLSVDSLALYYNKGMFNAAGIAEPPKTWEELVTLVPKLVEIDRFGNINRAAIALGTGSNINRSTDLVLALMLQMGAEANAGTAQQALDFYTQFSRRDSPLYTWSPREHYSIDAFYEGTLAMTINYSYHFQTFRQKNAKLNFAVAPLPQFTGQTPANFANYWGFAVSKNKTYAPDSNDRYKITAAQYQVARVHESWQLIHYLAFPHPGNVLTLYNGLSQTSKDVALKEDPTVQYLTRTGKPPARRDLIEGQKDSLTLAPFAAGNLIAKSWKPGRNPEGAERLLVDAIDSVNRGERTTQEALSLFWSRLGQFGQ